MKQARIRASRRAFVAGAATAGTVASVRAPARSAQFTWKFGSAPSADHPLNVRLNQAFARIKAETNGQVEIRLFPNSSLGSAQSRVSQLRLGAIEMMAEGGDILDSLIPVATVDNVPFAYAGYDAAHRAFDGTLGNLVRNEFAAKGMVALERVFDVGFRQITTSTRPVRVVDDMKGLKLRSSPSKFRIDFFTSLGAAPVPVDYAETYSALQTHVVDGQENPLAGIEDLKFYEVQKYCSMSNHMWGCFWTLINKDKWDSLSSSFQDIVRKHCNAAALAERADFAASEKTVRAHLTKVGLLFNEVDRASFKGRLKTTGFYERWRDHWGPAAWSEVEKYSGTLV